MQCRLCRRRGQVVLLSGFEMLMLVDYARLSLLLFIFGECFFSKYRPVLEILR